MILDADALMIPYADTSLAPADDALMNLTDDILPIPSDDAPAIPDEVDPAIPNAVALMCDGDPMIPLGIVFTSLSSFGTRHGPLSAWQKSARLSGGFAGGALSMSSWAGGSLPYATSKVPSAKVPDPVLAVT